MFERVNGLVEFDQIFWTQIYLPLQWSFGCCKMTFFLYLNSHILRMVGMYLFLCAKWLWSVK